MRLAIVLPDLRGGGAERVSLHLADALNDQGYQVEFVLMRAEGEFLTEARQRHSVVDLNVSHARHALGPLSRYCRRQRPDGLIAAMWPLTFIVPAATRLSRIHIPVLVVEHNTLSRQYAAWGYLHRLMLRMSLAGGFRLANACAGVSTGVSTDAAELAFCPPYRVRTLYNPIPQRLYVPAEAFEAAERFWGARQNGRRIIAVGSLKPQKNQAMLLRAFALLDDPNAKLIILGQGELEQELRTQARQLDISARVLFPGFQPHPLAFYQTADLFVSSSDWEGLPTVLIEALGCGLPVVSTDCPSGPAEILENGRHGRLTPVGDAEALARAMAEALDAPVDQEALKRRAADFSPERAARAYLDALGLP